MEVLLIVVQCGRGKRESDMQFMTTMISFLFEWQVGNIAEALVTLVHIHC